MVTVTELRMGRESLLQRPLPPVFALHFVSKNIFLKGVVEMGPCRVLGMSS